MGFGFAPSPLKPVFCCLDGGGLLHASLLLLLSALHSPHVLLCHAVTPDVFFKFNMEFLEVDELLLPPAQRIQRTLTRYRHHWTCVNDERTSSSFYTLHKA